MCNQFNTKVDKCNGIKTKEINMKYEKCFNKAKQDFIMEKCDTIKNKYVPLGLGRFLHKYIETNIISKPC